MASTSLPDLFCFLDTCNVYLVRDGDRAIAIDFGSGKWRSELPRLGVSKLEHVFLTHHHADQCQGLLKRKSWPFQIHAPAGEQRFLEPTEVAAHWRQQRAMEAFPRSYSMLPRGLTGIRYDMAGFGDLFWGRRRIRFIATPGHGPHALSIVMNHHGKQIVFCGDAAHDGATLWQPYQLEWDHWTGAGALAAWEGVRRLADLQIDLLCPSHGPVIQRHPRQVLERLATKLLKFHRTKGHICPGERDDYVEPAFLTRGVAHVLPNLIQFSTNGYLLLSKSGEALLIDPPADDAIIASLLAEIGHPKITAATATHYHGDHSEGLVAVRRRYSAKIWLHPWVNQPFRSKSSVPYAFFPKNKIRPDHLLPEEGRWRWNEYQFQIAPFPGQTWWHCAFMTRINDQKVLFGGDSFQPPSRWNGTGGFCSLNNSRFEGFSRSAKLVLRWKPDILATGHRTYYRFHASQFRKIAQWARRAEVATRALCPTGNLDTDYYLHHQ